jgi:hypothetical protein
LLAQLQEQLAAPSHWPRLSLHPRDQSLEFHACPGPLRQVQVVRDRVLQLLAADPSLEPRHILVMTPEVDRFAPLVAAVFGDSDATGVELPWRLTDRSQQSDTGVARGLLELLGLAADRLTASGLERLLQCRPLLRAFALNPAQANELCAVLQRVGFRWGLDGEERGGPPEHSLSWAIDRLLLGLVLPATPGLAPSNTAPFRCEAALETQGRWLALLRRLSHRHLLFAILTATRKRTTCGSSRECERGGAQDGSKHVLPFEARSVRVYAVLTLAKSTRGSPVGDPRGKNQVSNNMWWHAPHVAPVSVSDTEHVAAKDAVDRQYTSAARAVASGEHVVSSRRVIRVCATRSYKPQTSTCDCSARGSR